MVFWIQKELWIEELKKQNDMKMIKIQIENLRKKKNLEAICFEGRSNSPLVTMSFSWTHCFKKLRVPTIFSSDGGRASAETSIMNERHDQIKNSEQLELLFELRLKLWVQNQQNRNGIRIYRDGNSGSIIITFDWTTFEAVAGWSASWKCLNFTVKNEMKRIVHSEMMKSWFDWMKLRVWS